MKKSRFTEEQITYALRQADLSLDKHILQEVVSKKL
jgi:hypothetical protein